jgi:hypothetical protein
MYAGVPAMRLSLDDASPVSVLAMPKSASQACSAPDSPRLMRMFDGLTSR